MNLPSRSFLPQLLALGLCASTAGACGDDSEAADGAMASDDGASSGADGSDSANDATDADDSDADGGDGDESGGPETFGEPFSFDDPFSPQNHFAHRIVITLPDGTTFYNTRDVSELESRFNASADGGSQVVMREATFGMEFEATVDGTFDYDWVWTFGIFAPKDAVQLPGDLDFAGDSDGSSSPVIRFKAENESSGGQYFDVTEGTASTGTMAFSNCPSDVIDLPKAPTVPATDDNRLFGSFRDLEIEGPDGAVATISGDFAIGVQEIVGNWCG